jgi:Domain of unknown function (DUF1906)
LGQTPKSYFGFDKNDYPGDALLPALRRSFSYTGYWLNNPPGENSNSWAGKRATLKASGFGFMILYNGRPDAELKGKDAAGLGRTDAGAAIAAAQREGFAPGAILFLDQEEGGRLLPEQSAYLFSWVEAIRSSSYRPGVYCSGILVRDGSAQISTARDILSHDKKLELWVANDQCPPAPGCVLPKKPMRTASSGIPQAMIWQYALSPRREFARQCGATYATDNNCYAPDLPHSAQTFVDLDVSTSADPSGGR